MPYKNPEDSAARGRRYRAENAERIYEANKISHAKRRERDLEGVRADRCERSRKRRMTPGIDKETKRKTHLKSRYGLTVEQYQQMLDSQNGVCAICYNANPDGRRLHVDHDHSTGAIRALLCGRCNTTLGKMNESVALLNCMIEYIRDYEAPITEQKVD